MLVRRAAPSPRRRRRKSRLALAVYFESRLALAVYPGKQLAVFRYFSVRLRRREGEKRKTPYGGSTRVLGEPAAVLYRLGSIINHWNSRNKKSRGFFRYHYYHRARCRKEKTIV